MSFHISGANVVRAGSVTVTAEDLNLERGEVAILCGPNGCGKTTFFMAIAGLLQCSAGEFIFNGENLAGMPIEDRAARGVIFMLQQHRVFPQLTIRDHQRIGGVSREEFLQAIPRRFARVAANLSEGQKIRVALGTLPAAQQALFLLDEPLAGADAHLTETFRCFARERLDCGDSLIWSEHDASKYVGFEIRTWRFVTCGDNHWAVVERR